jgi:hypothetical protein
MSSEVEGMLGGSLWSIGCGGKALLMRGVTSAEERGRLFIVTLIVVCSVVVFHLREW